MLLYQAYTDVCAVAQDGYMHTLVSVFWCSLCFQRIPFKNIFDVTTAGDWDCVAAVERLPALHHIV